MKKLIITMAAITSLALVAKAQGESTDPKVSDRETFELRPIGAMDISHDDSDTSNGTRWWTTTNATDSIRYVGDCSVVAEGTEGESDYNKYLLVDTDTPIQRLVGSNRQPVEVSSNPGGNITTTFKVQFTAAEDAPTIDTNSDEKMAIFAIRTSETDVRLGVIDVTGVHTTEVAVVEDTWYTLEVVTTRGADNLRFAVNLVDGEGGKHAAGSDYVSRVDDPQINWKKLSTVGFEGTGKVDDIGFTYVAGVAEEKANVGVAESPWSEEAETSLYEVYVEYDFDQGSVSTGYSNPVEVMIGNSIPFYILLNVDPEGKQVTASVDGVAVPCAQVTGSSDTWVVTYDTTGLEANANVMIAISVTGGGEDPDPTTVTVNISNPSVATFTATIGGTEITSWPVTATVGDTIAITVTDSNYQTVTVGGANATHNGNTWTATYTVTEVATQEITITVTEKQPEHTEIEPGAGNESANVAAGSEDDAVALVKLVAPKGENDAVIVSDEAYNKYFTKTAEEISAGNYKVTVALKPYDASTGTGVPAPAVATETKTDTLAASLSTIAATAEAGNNVAVKVHNAKPGLYYTLKEGRDVKKLGQPSASVLATGEQVGLNVTIKGGNSGFYRIVVTAAPTPTDGANGGAKKVNAVEAVK